ncbi:MAG: hypothetical protein ISS31_09515 [Kiritimatiellae bacterium]|nr:hypothetical protein [Kiritimatiellia bacterium]
MRVVSVLMMLGFCSSLNAATITHVGTVTNDSNSEISQWRTAGTAKSLDADGDNIYGTAGKLVIQVLGDVPTYVQHVSLDPQLDPNAAYAVVDHPNDLGGDTFLGTTTSGAQTPGSVHDMFVFNVTNFPPTGRFRVGVATDGLDGAQFAPSEIRLTQLVGGAATASASLATITNKTLDMVFFDVVDAIPGDQFTVQGVAGAGGYATHQFVTWDDIPLPETDRIFNFNLGDKSTALAGPTLATATYALAATVDFNDDGADDVWNRAGHTTQGTEYTDVKDITGTATALTFKQTGVGGQNDDDAFTPTGAEWNNAFDVPYSGTDDTVAGNIMNSIFFVAGAGPITFTIGGLAPDRSGHVVEVFTALGSPALDHTITVNGTAIGPRDSEDLDPNNSRFLFWDVTSDGSGDIVIQVGSAGTAVVVQAIRLRTPPPQGTIITIQ